MNHLQKTSARKMFLLTTLSLVLLGLSVTLILNFANPTAFAKQSDNLWETMDESLARAQQSERQINPETYRAVKLNKDEFKKLLSRVPLESSDAAKNTFTEMTVPMPDGGFLRLQIEESPMMEPELAAKFPEIKTYQGRGIDDPTVYARFDWTPEGFHALVLRAGDAIQISPRAKGNVDDYLSYYTKDVPSPSDLKFMCGELEARDRQQPDSLEHKRSSVAISFGTSLRTYRLAVAATTRWTSAYGGDTTAGTISAITTVMNQVNAVYRTELSVRMVLVGNNDQIVYTTTFSGTYPYTDLAGDNATGTTNGENRTNLDNVIGSGNYDIGHIFGVYQSGQFAGLASVGVVCDGNKARGSSMFGGGLTSNPFNIYVVTHEMGHQFGATHSFNASCGGNRESGSAWEPDSGSTIMAYGSSNCQGTTGLQGNADLYFHGGNLTQIINYINGSAGCATTAASGNTPPNVSAGSNFTIPQQTPFALTATGSDPDGDAVRYGWEELDLGTQSPPNADDGSRPLFRSFSPVSSPTRLFPSLQYIKNFANVPPATNASGFVTGETLPATNRTMNFQVTARDNRTDGAVNTASMQVTVTTSSGPFNVTQPNSVLSWPVGSSQTITWDVANTTSAPVSCANVRITLSTDGGDNFPIVIAANTANDGSESFVVPNAITTQARIKIEAVGNIFFDMSDSNFRIEPSADLEVISKVAAPDPVVTGSMLTYTITARNNGPTFANNAVVNDNLPFGATFNSCVSTGGGVCGGSGQNRTVTFGTLSAGATATITLIAEANCALMDGALITNTATISSPTFDPNPSNNSKMVTVTAKNPPPVITCPTNRDAVAATPGSTTAIVTFPAPTVVDNCPGATSVCVPASGSALPLGTTTVTCTATDSGGATASCSFTVTVWDASIQDEDSGDYLLFNTFTGDYKFVRCGVGGFTMIGQGEIKRVGCVTSLHDDSRINASYDRCSIAPRNSGEATIKKFQPNTTFILKDRNILNNSPSCPTPMP